MFQNAVNPNIPMGFNNPYGPMGVGSGRNEANYAFAPPGGITTGMGSIADMVANSVVKKLLGDTPMLRTFSRPQMSDYAFTVAQQRQALASEKAPAINAMDPFLRSLGALGKSPTAQSLIGNFTPGGSMTEAFNVILGRFGSKLAGPGMRNGDAQAAMAENMLQNVNAAVTDENGIYDYNRTAGFTRAESFRNLAEWSDKFGGSVASDLALKGDSEGNKAKIKKAQQGFTEINETVREAQNLFGKDKGLGELMDSVNDLIESSGQNMTTGQVRGMLQKIQATAAVVDMSNESIVRYFDMMKNLYKGMNVQGNLTNKAQQDLLSAKGIVDARKAAMKEGQTYTGPGVTEEAQNQARRRAQVENSGQVQTVKSAIATLSSTGGQGRLKKRLVELYNQNKFDEAIEEYNNSQDITDEDRKRGINMMQAMQEGRAPANLEEILRKEGVKDKTGQDIAQLHRDYVLRQLTEEGSTTAEFMKTLAPEKKAKLLETLKDPSKFNSEMWKDREATLKSFRENAGLTEEEAFNTYQAIEQQAINQNDEGALLEGLQKDLLDSSAIERGNQAQQNVEDLIPEFEAAGKRAGMLRDVNAGDALSVGAKIYQRLKKKGVDVDNLTVEEMLRVSGEEGKKWLGMDPNSKEYQEMAKSWGHWTGKDTTLQEKLDEADKYARENAEKDIQLREEKGGEFKSGDYKSEEERQKAKEAAVQQRYEELKSQYNKQAMKEAGFDTEDKEGGAGTEGENGSDTQNGLKQLLDKIDEVVAALRGKDPQKEEDNPRDMRNYDPNGSVTTPQNGPSWWHSTFGL